MRRRRVKRLLLVIMLVNCHWTKIQFQLLRTLVSQVTLPIDGAHSILDTKDQMQKRFHQNTQRNKSDKTKDGGRDQREEEDAQCEGIEDGEEGNEFNKWI